MNPTEKYLRQSLLQLWQRDINEREVNGPNRSKMIDQINVRLHVPLGSPYCIGGLLVRGVESLCTLNKLVNPVVMTAGTQDFFNRTPSKFIKAKGKSLALVSDIGILVNNNDRSHGHAFGFSQNETLQAQKTIEYNTNGQGSRDGDGVHELTRTQAGTSLKTYRGSVDVVAWIMSANPKFAGVLK